VLDLTIDGAGTTNCDGICLTGDHMVIRRVKVVNVTGKDAEIFPIYILGGVGASGGSISKSDGNVIEDCEVNLPDITWVSAIWFVGNSTNYASGMVRNNRVILGAYKPGRELAAIHLENDHDSLVEGNYVEGGNCGFYAEASLTGLLIDHNTFKNVEFGAYFRNQGSTNITCAFNSVELAASPKDAYGFLFSPPCAFRNLTIIGNTIRFSGVPASRRTYGAHAASASGLSLVNNVMDNRLLVVTDSSTGVNIYNNSDLVGNSLAINREPPRAVARTTVTAPGAYSAKYSDRYIGIHNPGLTSIFLPPASGWAGKEFVIAREDGGASFTLLSRGGLIDGTNAVAITKVSSSPAASTTVISDGTNWYAR